MPLICLLLPFLVLRTSGEQTSVDDTSTSAVLSAAPWDIDGPCQPFVEKLSLSIGNIAKCAASHTIPPKVCTNCFEEYMEYRQMVYDTKHLTDVMSLDNSTCSDVIYRNYLLSYVAELSDSIENRIWEASRCSDCLTFTWRFETGNSTFTYIDLVEKFAKKLLDWRNCTTTYSDLPLDFGNYSTVCSNCNDIFTDLYQFYWQVYIDPNVNFCVDVETTMNDTARMWNDVLKCAVEPNRSRDAVPVMITAGLLLLFTIFFYMSSCIQGGGEARLFVQYSRLTNPQPARRRLLSSSASDSNLASRVVRTPTPVSNPGWPSVQLAPS